jgi:hypothetical protein
MVRGRWLASRNQLAARANASFVVVVGAQLRAGFEKVARAM